MMQRPQGVTTRLFLIIACVTAPALTGLVGYSYISLLKVESEARIRDAGFMGMQAEGTISSMVSDLKDVSDFLAANRTVRDYVQSGSPQMRLSTSRPLEELVFNLIVAKRNVSFFALYGMDGGLTFHIASDTSHGIQSGERLMESSEGRQIIQAYGGYVFLSIPQGKSFLMSGNARDKLVLGRLIKNPMDGSSIGMIFLAVNADTLASAVFHGLSRENAGMALIRPDGEYFISSTAFNGVGMEAGYRGQVTELPDWSIEVRHSGHVMKRRIRGLTFRHLIVLAGVLTLSWILIHIAISRVLTPLHRLAAAMERVQDTQFEEEVPVDRIDEIGLVSTAYNEMIQRLKGLIQENYLLEIREKEAELDALQSRIHPHFLYNTLDTIYWTAQEQGAGEAAEMAYSLGQVLRLSLNRGKGSIPLHQELEIIQQYLHIQKPRITGGLQQHMFIEEGLQEEMIPKLILQPLVENAVIHGFNNSKGPNILEIDIRKSENDMVLTVRDNRCGFRRPGQKDSAEAVPHCGFALANIQERLNIRYGEAAGFQISSPAVNTPGTSRPPIAHSGTGGTQVVILIPLEGRQ